MGPTASGKTGLAMYLCERFPFEVISVDASQVYRGMDVGTAKPSAEELARVPHRLLDIRDPSEPYSAAQFREDALREMADIVANGRIPLLVGGTMFYFRALERGLSELPAADPAVRERLWREGERIGWPAMHARLADIDPVTAARIDTNDPQRIQRALEVVELTGEPPSRVMARSRREPIPYRIIKLAIAPADRAVLHRRIEQRFREMLKAGLVEEVQALMARADLSPDLPAVRTVGYRQVWQCLKGEVDPAEMADRGIFATRQLAKRQLTWLRGEPDMHWFDSSRPGFEAKIVEFLSTLRVI
jgi:tRNA dimethylallyltransferase